MALVSLHDQFCGSLTQFLACLKVMSNFILLVCALSQRKYQYVYIEIYKCIEVYHGSTTSQGLQIQNVMCLLTNALKNHRAVNF